MSKRIVDYNPHNGITTYFDYDHASDTTYVGTEQDVSLILDLNTTLRNDGDYSKKGVKDSWLHYATYPPIIINKWLAEYGVNVFKKEDQKKVKQLTERPEYRYLKTTTKRIWG